MASDPQYDVAVRGGPGTQSNYAPLGTVMDAVLGSTVGTISMRAIAGWTGIAFPHFSVRAITGVVATTGGAILSFRPAEGSTYVILRAVLVVLTKSTGAATVDIGVGSTATTAADNLIDGCDVGTAGSVSFDNLTNPGTNGLAGVYMNGTSFINVTGLADTTGLVGNLYVEFIKI